MKNPQLGLAAIPVAAAFLSVSRGKMYAMVNAGECPSKRFGKSVRVPWSWLHAQAETKEDGSESNGGDR